MSGVDLGDVSDLADGQLRVFAAPGARPGDHGILVCRIAGVLHALVDNCSHRDAQLSTGRLRGTVITCPVHGAQFDVRTGAHLCAPATAPVACLRVDEVDGRAVLAPEG